MNIVENEAAAATIPEDDLSELVSRMARSRLDEQRASMPESKEEATTA